MNVLIMECVLIMTSASVMLDGQEATVASSRVKRTDTAAVTVLYLTIDLLLIH